MDSKDSRRRNQDRLSDIELGMQGALITLSLPREDSDRDDCVSISSARCDASKADLVRALRMLRSLREDL
jgi:hypothetical protein